MFLRVSSTIVLLLSFLMTGQAAAEEINADTFLAKDRFELAASFNFSSQAQTGDSYFNLNPSVGYFIKDRLSLNGQLQNQYSNVNSKLTGTYGLGASYYFNINQQFAPFINQLFNRTYGSSDATMGGTTSFGVLNFLAPNVAFKTSLAYEYNFESSINSGLFSMVGAFSIFF